MDFISCVPKARKPAIKQRGIVDTILNEIHELFAILPRKRMCIPLLKISHGAEGDQRMHNRRKSSMKCGYSAYIDTKEEDTNHNDDECSLTIMPDTLFYKFNDFLAQALCLTPGGGMIGLGGASPVVMSLCPPIFGAPPMCDKFAKLLVDAQPDPSSWSMETHQKGLLVVTFAQGVMGITRICMGDIFGGIYALLLATLGYNSRIPGPAANWLKTYVLITFINGTVGAVDFFNHMIMKNYPVLSLALPFTVNLAHFMVLAVPVVSFSGALFGWEFVKAQKNLIMDRQKQILQNQQQGVALPWPPPPLPAPEVLQRMQQFMDKAHGICPNLRSKMEKDFEEQQAKEEALERERALRLESEAAGAGIGLCS